ncbi:MAG: hypothetical protein WBM32_12925, partial [Crocosphaera sp.]
CINMTDKATVENSSKNLNKSAILSEDNVSLVSEKIEAEIDKLFAKITHLIINYHQGLTEELQEEIAKISIVLQKVKKISSSHHILKKNKNISEIKALLYNLDLAIESLQIFKTTTLAKKLHINAEFTIRKVENRMTAGLINFWESFRLQSSLSFKIVLGLILAIPLYIGTPIALYSGADFLEKVLEKKGVITQEESARESNSPDLYKKDYDMMITLATLCFIGGSTGSIISILSRISDYRKVQNESQLQESLTPILVGLCKPMIGGTFGILIYTLIAGAIIPIQFGYTTDQQRQDLRWLSFYSVAFVVGFSERLAKDIITNTENQFKPNNSEDFNPSVLETSETRIDDEDIFPNTENQFKLNNSEDFNTLVPAKSETRFDDEDIVTNTENQFKPNNSEDFNTSEIETDDEFKF